jgi:hypothetical protein
MIMKAITAQKFAAELKKAGMRVMPGMAGEVDLGIPTMWARRYMFAGGLEFAPALAYLLREKARLQASLLPCDRGTPDLSAGEGVRG